MPGRPTPTRAADLLSGRDGRTDTVVHVQTPRAGSQAETSRAIEQIDRRLNARPGPPDWLHVGPDSPGLNSRKAWLRPRRTET